ncbi:DUF3987 domain-containing protein [Variovorax sp. PBL-E5]|uniref:DUF3987 domain-containing protein n=1 Tax=Variovorax sp. PBL-E5 TaxID=434014 RepID=UPI001316EC7E|nr:DUF3987 domain-containing protein [Variovorax sp. PBL-E5]VTU28424.1 hypothetical protein E5CHR_02606 [Variovorax sp. PBL-E5]
MNVIKKAVDAAQPVSDADDDHVDLHRNAPRPEPACLHGLIGEIARTAAETTEANPFAVAANMIAYMSAAVGRGTYLPVGNTWHHARLFVIHVGRTGRGRKGDAVSIVHRIDKAIRQRNEHLPPQVHRGGLSSREGLAYLIHDGFSEGKTEVEAVHDKRLWVVESEFANVLSQTKREGNTLSAALRDCWDGVSIRPATKGNRVWATDPHVTMSCAVTPGEMRTMLAARELTNGFANRFLLVWAERNRVLPFPQATPQNKIDEFAEQIITVLKAVGADRPVDTDAHRAVLTPAAQKLYAKLYLGELNDQSAGELVSALLERRAPTLLRLAMLFAICDISQEVDVQHIEAALAWVRYWSDSVKFVFATAMDEETAAEISATADRIVRFLSERGTATRSAITTECFGGHLNKDKIDAALEELLVATPPVIEVETIPTQGRSSKVYRMIGAKNAKVAKNEQPRGFATDFDVRKESEVGEIWPREGIDTSQLRGSRGSKNQAETRASPDSSLTSQADCESATVEARL